MHMLMSETDLTKMGFSLSLFFFWLTKAKDYIFAHKNIKKTDGISHRPNPKDFIAKQTSLFLLSFFLT